MPHRHAPPPKEETATQIIIAHIQQAAPRPRTLKPGIPQDLEDAILRCLAKDPARRWQKVSELNEILDAVSTRADAA